MGCWDETCAVSGLPILAKNPCYRIVFDDAIYIALCAEGSAYSCLKHIKSVELGTYDNYGGLENFENNSEFLLNDGVVFILKHFWEHAIKPSEFDFVKNYIEDEWLQTIEQVERYDVIVDDWVSKGLDKNKLDVYQIPAYHIYQQSPEIYKNLLYIISIMTSLRRTFYTAAYRGGQSTDYSWKVQSDMNEAIKKYIEQKIQDGAIDISNVEYW